RPPGSFPLSSSRRAPCAIALPRRCGFAQLRAAPSEPPAEPSRRGFSSGILEEEHTMRRRDFLHPRHLAGAAGHVLGALDSVRDLAPESADQLAVLRLGWRAMATGWEIVLPFNAPDALSAGQEAFALLDAIEDRLTVYRDHSEMCRVNQKAQVGPVRV